MRRRLLVLATLLGLLSALAVSCTPPPKPTVAFQFVDLRYSLAAGADSGDDVTYSFRTTNAPAGSRLLMQQAANGRWVTIKTLAPPAGSASFTAQFGRTQFRLALVDARGALLAQARRQLDGYRSFTFAEMFGVPRKHTDIYRPADYDFRDAVLVRKTSCNQFRIISTNQGTTKQTLRVTLTSTAGSPRKTTDYVVETAYEIGAFVAPGTDWAIRALGDNLYTRGTAICFTFSGEIDHPNPIP